MTVSTLASFIRPSSGLNRQRRHTPTLSAAGTRGLGVGGVTIAVPDVLGGRSGGLERFIRSLTQPHGNGSVVFELQRVRFVCPYGAVVLLCACRYLARAVRKTCWLSWDVLAVPHHCSYRSLGPEKGKDKTEPVMEVAWLLEEGRTGGVLVSTSDRIQSADTIQPPHRQAAAYYQERADAIDGEFVVTMQHPSAERPDRLIIEISGDGATLRKRIVSSAAVITGRPAPRAG
jgi:hypothetical protein